MSIKISAFVLYSILSISDLCCPRSVLLILCHTQQQACKRLEFGKLFNFQNLKLMQRLHLMVLTTTNETWHLWKRISNF